MEKTASDAPVWMNAEQASAWADGYNAAGRDDKLVIDALFAELQYVLSTGDISDSERNSADLRDMAARRLGYPDRKAFAFRDSR
jgi:hypothetical protein